jgi:hypothetical protein
MLGSYQNCKHHFDVLNEISLTCAEPFNFIFDTAVTTSMLTAYRNNNTLFLTHFFFNVPAFTWYIKSWNFFFNSANENINIKIDLCNNKYGIVIQRG